MGVEWGLDRVAKLPTGKYAKGPTLGPEPKVQLTKTEDVDRACRALLNAIPDPARREIALPSGKNVFAECYDPWTNTIVIPDYPSQAERQRLLEHGMGHARGGSHPEGLGHGEWTEAPWSAWYGKKPNVFAGEEPPVSTGNVFRGK